SLGLPRGGDVGNTDRRQPLPLVSLLEVINTVRRLEKSIALRRALFLSHCAQAVFLPSLLIYAWFFPPFDIFPEGTWAEEFADVVVTYSESVPKYIPSALPKGFSFGTHFPAAEVGTIWGIFLAAVFFEWIEQPVRRGWIFSLFQLIFRG